MTDYTARIGIRTEADEDTIAEAIVEHHGVYSYSPAEGDVITISYPAEGAVQATMTALAIARTLGEVTAVEVLTSAEFDRRASLIPVPELVSVTEAAEALGVSRAAIVKRIEAGTLVATKVGSTYVIPAEHIIEVIDRSA